MSCKDCKYCQKLERSHARSEYFCINPKLLEMNDKPGYPINNFIGYGDRTCESHLQLKTRKQWCPLESEE